MNIKFEMIELLIGILEKDCFDQDMYNEIIKTKEFQDFMIHEEGLNRKTSIETIKENLIKTINGSNNDKECYCFNKIRNHKNEIKKKIYEIKENKEQFEKKLVEKMKDYVLTDNLADDITVYFYGGSYDYGFCILSGESYINIGNMGERMDCLEDVLAHEYYHGRKRKGEIPDYDFSREEYLKTLMFHILEEGIATLIQFEYEKKYDGFAFISKDRFEAKYEYMSNLDKCIKEIEINNNYSKQVILNYFDDSIPNYIVGYWIGQVLFEEMGTDGLNIWSIDADYKQCFKIFINSLRKKEIRTGLSLEVENFLLNF